ncbi:hypothetical protein [Hominiventricola filiformis]|uniref:Lipoprotein n=1 Tax=Hominiventricola filiformis TaxID=2885352 RepID=A0AAE3A7Z0_9FIRM|nr:hypothetical protein [Hominiventricola filiformis]MCC2126209.1 hypothetical protein [Hominiventricola filiformis]
MKNRRILTVVLAVIMAFGLVACGGGNKPAETDAAEPETKETTEEIKVDEPKEEEGKVEEAEPEEPQSRIPENATEFLLTNPKLQAQASFYLPKFDSEWEVKLLSDTDPVGAEQRYLYKAMISDEQSVHVDARLTATTTENLPTIMEKGEKVKVSGHDAVYEEDTTSWKYTVDMGPYADGVEMYMDLKFYTGGEEFKDVKELAETRDMMLETLSATTDYEGKEDRSGRLYQGSGLCSLPMTFEYNGQEAEVKQELRRASVYALAAEIQEDGDIPLCITAEIDNTCKNSYMEVTESDGYVDCTIAGYPGKLKQVEYPSYVENYVRLTVSDVNYEMYASTSVDTDKITDAIALASATKAFKEDKASQYQKSLDFLEAMVSAAEFRDISEDWLK